MRALFSSLNFGVGPTMAGLAECNKIRELIRLFVFFKTKESEGSLMVNMDSRRSAILTSLLVSLESLPFLGLPIWAASLVRSSIQVLRMILSYPMRVAAGSRTVLPSSFSAVEQPTVIAKIRPSAIQASKQFSIRSFLESPRFVLAFWRAIFPSPMLEARWNAVKFFFTMRARQSNHVFYCKVNVGTRQEWR